MYFGHLSPLFSLRMLHTDITETSELFELSWQKWSLSFIKDMRQPSVYILCD